ncbi:MAG: hypothetical protein JEY99_11035 [Spirochaetales bacterium]|nr:hypothetical protein [Spirochaetales bacterium]
MIRKINTILVLTISIIILSGCATVPETHEKIVTEKTANFGVDEYSPFLNTWPEGSTPVFLGTSKRMINREDELTAALMTAGFRASIYNSVRGLSKAYTEQSSSGSGRQADFQMKFDESSAMSIAGNMEVISELQDSKGTYLLARYKDGASINLPPKISLNLNPSSWINNTPRIPGYIVSVGTTRQLRHPSDSITAADKRALEEMVKSISLEISEQKNTINTQSGSASVKSTLEIADATIQGFYIIARYVTPDGKNYYSLGVAPLNKN